MGHEVFDDSPTAVATAIVHQNDLGRRILRTGSSLRISSGRLASELYTGNTTQMDSSSIVSYFFFGR